jgi:hypothetical protein
MANRKATPVDGFDSVALLAVFHFGNWFGEVVERLVGYLGISFRRLFDRTKRCYRHLEKRLNKEEEPCQVGFLWMMAHIARGQGWHQKLLAEVKDSPVKPAGDNICAVMYAPFLLRPDAWGFRVRGAHDSPDRGSGRWGIWPPPQPTRHE